MQNETPPSPDAIQVESDGLLSRFFGIIFSPAETFQKVVNKPVWLGMLLLVSVIAGLLIGGFLMTEVGQEAWLDAALEAVPPESEDAQMEALENILPYISYIGVAQGLFGVALVTLILAGVLYLVFSVMGGTATFRQLFAVVVHSNVTGAIHNLFMWPLNYFRDSMESPTTLTALLPMLEEGSFLYYFLNVIDLFIIWWIIVLSIGLCILYKKKTKSIALSLFVVYGLIALIVALVRGS
jgi:hypothetical protein